MKKKLPIILVGVILACVLVFGFLYANNDIGKTANSLEADIRQSQKILDDWIVDGSISDTMAAFISYPQDKTDHTFSVYVNRPGLSFGYFFRGGGDIVEVDDYIAEFVVEGNNERAFISMNTQNIVRLEVDDGNGIQVIDIDSGKPFAIVLPLNVETSVSMIRMEMLWNIFANNFDQLQFTELNTTTEYRKTDR